MGHLNFHLPSHVRPSPSSEIHFACRFELARFLDFPAQLLFGGSRRLSLFFHQAKPREVQTRRNSILIGTEQDLGLPNIRTCPSLLGRFGLSRVRLGNHEAVYLKTRRAVLHGDDVLRRDRPAQRPCRAETRRAGQSRRALRHSSVLAQSREPIPSRSQLPSDRLPARPDQIIRPRHHQ